MSKTQAALQRRLGRLSMLVDLAAQFLNGHPLMSRLRTDLGILKDPTQSPDQLQRTIGRMMVQVEIIRKEIPEQREFLDAMLKELSMATEIVSRIDIPEQAPAPKARGRR